MIELPDDELDRLFRKSSEELDPYFDPNDWNDLKKRLDDEDGIRPAGWLRKWWPLGIMLIFLAGGLATYIVMDNNTKPESLINKVASERLTITPNPESDEIVRKIESKTGTKNIASKNLESKNLKPLESVSNPTSVKEKLTKSKSEKILPLNRSKAGGVYLEPNRSSGKVGEGAFSSNLKRKVLRPSGNRNGVLNSEAKDKTVSEFAQKLDKSSNLATENGRIDVAPAISATSATKINNTSADPRSTRLAKKSGDATIGVKQQDRDSGSQNNDIKGQQESPESQGPVTREMASFLPVNMLVAHPFEKLELALPAIDEVEQQKVTAPPSKQIVPTPMYAIRFSYSPDLTSVVGLKDFSKPGAAFSLLGEFALLRKLYIQTGVVRTVKEYSSDGGGYIFPKYVTDVNTPNYVDGTCKMLEIPLGFRFDITSSDRSRWFAGTGMSSYYMQNEKYQYKYAKYVHMQKTGWQGKTGWYLFSHINASAGYEYRFSKKLSLMAEPYVHIPIKEAGYLKAKLFTAGVWVSVRYTPVFR